MIGWWSSCQRGVRSSEPSTKLAKGVNNRKMHRWSNEHTLAWLDDETTKPSRHTCSTRLNDGVSDKHDTRDWPLINKDGTYVIVNVTSCVSATDAFIENTTRTYKAKTLSITRTWPQVWIRHQHVETWVKWTSKADAKTSTAHGVNLRVCSHQEKLPREASKLGAGQNFGG